MQIVIQVISTTTNVYTSQIAMKWVMIDTSRWWKNRKLTKATMMATIWRTWESK